MHETVLCIVSDLGLISLTLETKEIAMAKGREVAGGGEGGGFIHHNVEFQLSIARFQKAGGEYGVGLAMFNAAYGRSEFVRGRRADARPGLGHTSGADEASDKRHTPATPRGARRRWMPSRHRSPGRFGS